ncbi:unnamed protein product [marine sediment metagenome]|uniref:Helix-turn-helix domain-containing protein n=1 Tax=marine sediment metagenome TaxID=412755 RepID=X0WPC1_9ZZZZ
MGTVFMAKPDGKCKQEVALSYQAKMTQRGYVVVPKVSQATAVKAKPVEAVEGQNEVEVIPEYDPISIKMAADIMGKHGSTIRKYMKDGKLKNIGESGSPLVCKNQVAELMSGE